MTTCACTVDGESPLSYRGDCRDALDEAALEIELGTEQDVPPYADFPDQFVASVRECPTPDVWIDEAIGRLGLGEDAVGRLRAEACALVDDARSCPS